MRVHRRRLGVRDAERVRVERVHVGDERRDARARAATFRVETIRRNRLLEFRAARQRVAKRRRARDPARVLARRGHHANENRTGTQTSVGDGERERARRRRSRRRLRIGSFASIAAASARGRRDAFSDEPRQRADGRVVEEHGRGKIDRETRGEGLAELHRAEGVESALHQRVVVANVAGTAIQQRRRRVENRATNRPNVRVDVRVHRDRLVLVVFLVRLVSVPFIVGVERVEWHEIFVRRRAFPRDALGERVPVERVHGDGRGYRRRRDDPTERVDALFRGQRPDADARQTRQRPRVVDRHASRVAAPRAPLHGRDGSPRESFGDGASVERGVGGDVIRLARGSEKRGDGREEERSRHGDVRERVREPRGDVHLGRGDGGEGTDVLAADDGVAKRAARVHDFHPRETPRARVATDPVCSSRERDRGHRGGVLARGRVASRDHDLPRGGHRVETDISRASRSTEEDDAGRARAKPLGRHQRPHGPETAAHHRNFGSTSTRRTRRTGTVEPRFHRRAFEIGVGNAFESRRGGQNPRRRPSESRVDAARAEFVGGGDDDASRGGVRGGRFTLRRRRRRGSESENETTLRDGDVLALRERERGRRRPNGIGARRRRSFSRRDARVGKRVGVGSSSSATFEAGRRDAPYRRVRREPIHGGRIRVDARRTCVCEFAAFADASAPRRRFHQQPRDDGGRGGRVAVERPRDVVASRRASIVDSNARDGPRVPERTRREETVRVHARRNAHDDVPVGVGRVAVAGERPGEVENRVQRRGGNAEGRVLARPAARVDGVDGAPRAAETRVRRGRVTTANEIERRREDSN